MYNMAKMNIADVRRDMAAVFRRVLVSREIVEVTRFGKTVGIIAPPDFAAKPRQARNVVRRASR